MKLPRVCFEVPMIACLIPTSLPFIEITYFTALAYSKFHEIGESETLQVHWATPMAAGVWWNLCLLGLPRIINYQTCASGQLYPNDPYAKSDPIVSQ